MTVSADIHSEMFSSESGDGLLMLLILDHPDLGSPIRVAANGEDVLHAGETYTGFPVEIVPPTDDPDEPSTSQIALDNVSREIMQRLRQIPQGQAITAEFFAVRLKNTEQTEKTYPKLKLRDVKPNGLRITGNLSADDLALEAVSFGAFTPGYFPGLFTGLS